jgi:hypothetical protein
MLRRLKDRLKKLSSVKHPLVTNRLNKDRLVKDRLHKDRLVSHRSSLLMSEISFTATEKRQMEKQMLRPEQ